MAAIKQHRLLSDDEVLSITECTDDQLRIVEEELGAIASKVSDGLYEPGTYLRLVKEGKLTGSVINLDNKASVVVIHSLNALNYLIVDGIVAINRCPLSTIFDSVEVLARSYKSKMIIFVTKLKAIARMAKARGYKPTGILFLKNALPA